MGAKPGAARRLARGERWANHGGKRAGNGAMNEALLIGAISGLATVIAILWRQLLAERAQAATERAEADADKREASRLIFALLSQRGAKREPASTSTPERPQWHEARHAAGKLLNGDVQKLCEDYLASEPPPPGRKTMWSEPR